MQTLVKNDNYRITDHLRERFVERTHKKFVHLRQCKGCQICRDLAYEINDILKDKRKIDLEIRNLLAIAEEDRSFLNDSNFMFDYYEKYGFDHNIRFFVIDPLVFVCIESKDGTKVIPTCLQSNRHIAVKHTKFKKKVS